MTDTLWGRRHSKFVKEWVNECGIFLVFAGELDRALCSRVVAAKGEVVEKGHTVEQAQFGRDALAKASVNFTSV